MATVATWMRAKDEKYFAPFFDDDRVVVRNAARADEIAWDETGGLLLTGGADVAPEFLHQPVPDRSIVDPELDLIRDRWEFAAIEAALRLSLPILAICKGMQTLNVALGGTLHLDIPGHNAPEQKERDVQALRTEATARHRFSMVNSSHHQAIDRLGEGLKVEAWCANDDVIEQVRLDDYPFALGVQYHPERGTIYHQVFNDFLSQLRK